MIKLDPLNDPNFPSDYATDDPHDFLDVAKKSRSCALFIDEAGEYLDRGGLKEMEWCGTRARHWGHSSHFIAQRATQVNRLVRDQCSVLFVFKVSYKDAKLLAEEFACKELEDACNLKKGEYYYITRYQPIEKRRLF